MALFLRVYGTLPRAGPGADAHTRRALALVPGEAPARVLDLGCGPGAQTLALAAALPGAEILALDLSAPLVARARERIEQVGLAGRVRVEVGDMASPPVEPASQDLICSEGAIYNLGVRVGLEAWRRLLAPGGVVIFTEAIWRVPDPPPELRRWWEAEYPAITDEAGVRAEIEAAGYASLASFPLPPSAWWDEYYAPMRQRIEELVRDLPEDPVAGEIAATAREEIALFERFSDAYTYGYFVAAPLGEPEAVRESGSRSRLGG
ncbi:MAG: class I SAM-dependent methyltransferase [Deltaproteobacteria bacterium]|nr:class I SAM-dependent methyltransferase [Deltaproteobacteria bacterium]